MNQTLVTQRIIEVTFTSDSACVRVWAPMAQSVNIRLSEPDLTIPLINAGNYRQSTVNQLHPGDRYAIVPNGTLKRSDTASLAQPDGVHGPSQAIDTNAFVWNDGNWRNLPLEDYLFYELHKRSGNGRLFDEFFKRATVTRFTSQQQRLEYTIQSCFYLSYPVQ